MLSFGELVQLIPCARCFQINADLIEMLRYAVYSDFMIVESVYPLFAKARGHTDGLIPEEQLHMVRLFSFEVLRAYMCEEYNHRSVFRQHGAELQRNMLEARAKPADLELIKQRCQALKPQLVRQTLSNVGLRDNVQKGLQAMMRLQPEVGRTIDVSRSDGQTRTLALACSSLSITHSAPW